MTDEIVIPEKSHGLIFTTFRLHGPELDPDQVTAATGITPDESWDLSVGYGSWSISTTAPIVVDLRYLREEINQSLTNLLELVRSKWEEFAEIGKQHYSTVSVSAHIDTRHAPENPFLYADRGDGAKRWGVEVSISKRNIRIIAALYAAVDIAVHFEDRQPR